MEREREKRNKIYDPTGATLEPGPLNDILYTIHSIAHTEIKVCWTKNGNVAISICISVCGRMNLM